MTNLVVKCEYYTNYCTLKLTIIVLLYGLAAFSAAPRQGHLAAVLHLYGYLKKHTKSKMVFDPTPMEHVEKELKDWSDFCKPCEEVVPSDMPEPRGKAIQTTCFVDSDHAGDAINRRSRTGVLIYCGMAPGIFYSKKQGKLLLRNQYCRQ